MRVATVILLGLLLAPLLVGASADPEQPGAPPGVVRAGVYRLCSDTTASMPQSGGSVYDVGAFPLPPPELPAGEGRDATVAMCSVCHSLRYITMQPPLPAGTWRATVRKMIDVHGAPIPEDVAQRITKYLQEQLSSSAR